MKADTFLFKGVWGVAIACGGAITQIRTISVVYTSFPGTPCLAIDQWLRLKCTSAKAPSK